MRKREKQIKSKKWKIPYKKLYPKPLIFEEKY